MYFRLLRNIGVIAGVALIGATPAFSFNIRIPRIGLNYPVNNKSQDYGPYLYYRSGTTIGIAGHRVTPMPPFYSYGPFRYIDRLRPGDLIFLGPEKFIVFKHLILAPYDTWILKHFAGLVLSACTPPHQAYERYVILAKQANE